MKQLSGFTLLELILVTTMMLILFALTVPTLQTMLEQNRAKTNINQIVAAMQFTKTKAIALGTPVTFCMSADRKQCGGNWRDGQIVIAQDNQVLRNLPAITPTDALIWNGNLGVNNAIVFLPTGFPNGQQGSFYYCPNHSSDNALAIIMEMSGRIRISNTAADGGKIVC